MAPISFFLRSDPVGANKWAPPFIKFVKTSFYNPNPIAAISATYETASNILKPHLFIFYSHSGKSFGITYGKLSDASWGLSPIFHINLHFASKMGSSGDIGLFSSVYRLIL